MILEPIDPPRKLIPQSSKSPFVRCALIRIKQVIVNFVNMQSTLARFIRRTILSTPSTACRPHVSKEVIGDESAGDDEGQQINDGSIYTVQSKSRAN